MTIKELCLKLAELTEQNKISANSQVYYSTTIINNEGKSEFILELVTEIHIDDEKDAILQ